MKNQTTLEQIDEHLSKPWNRGYLVTISNRLTGTKAYCVEIKSSKSVNGDRFFLKKEEYSGAEEIINKYNKVRSDAKSKNMREIKERARVKKEKKEKDALETLDPDLTDDTDDTDDIEDMDDIENIEEPDGDISEFSEKLLKVIKKRDEDK